MGYELTGKNAGCYLVVGTIKASNSEDDKKINFGDSVMESICPESVISLTDELYVGVRYGDFFTFTAKDEDTIQLESTTSFDFIGVDSHHSPNSKHLCDHIL